MQVRSGAFDMLSCKRGWVLIARSFLGTLSGICGASYIYDAALHFFTMCIGIYLYVLMRIILYSISEPYMLYNACCIVLSGALGLLTSNSTTKLGYDTIWANRPLCEVSMYADFVAGNK